MTKHWTKEEDEFVHSYHKVGDFIGSHDLGRRDSSIGPRIRKLKAAGVWDAMSVEKLAGGVWLAAFKRSQIMWDEADLARVDWMARNAPAILAAMEAGLDIQCADGVAKAVPSTALDEAGTLIEAYGEAARQIYERHIRPVSS